jgi:hypothetical protein
MKTITTAGSAVLGLVLVLSGGLVQAAEQKLENAERQQCTRNLKQIYQAIRAYQLEHRDLPAWFSDLVPKHLPDTNVFLCPTHRRTHKDQGYGVPDPKLRSSYFYEFCDAEVPGFGTAETGWKQGMTMKEWKMKQLLIYGAEVPLVRCWYHTPLLNVSFSGEVYESDQYWEFKWEGPRLLARALKTAGEAPRPLAEWGASGGNPDQYEMGIDPVMRYAGQPAARLCSKTNKIEGFGTYMEHFKADRFRGHRVRMSAQVKTESVEQWAGMWMRVDGPEGEMLAFDNMQGRPIKGTVDWNSYSIVLDLPAKSQLIAAGLLLTGPGKAWIADVKFEQVSQDVASTDMTKGGKP